ncbi:hypothetical protein [Parapedobacter soli]|uniref:hypothetical protein n=1 Tax=Parapedobacter soli TaxID=416955 RepID=UPI0021C8E80C|nr:hypothetical protein [Parapedobacter soli]
MKNSIILILLALLACAAWWIFRNPPQAESPIERQAKENVKVEAEIISRKVDEKGLEAVIMEETEHVLTQAGVNQATDSAGIIDSIMRLLHDERGVRNRVLQSYTQARAEIKRLQLVMSETDTSFNYKDKWLTVDVIKPLGDRPPLLNHTYNMELNWMWYSERKWLLAKRRTYGRFWPNDPNATIMGLKHIRIEPPERNTGIAVMAVGEYYRGDVLMGGGVSLDIGRLRLQGNYLHDFESGNWYPAFRGGYKIVDIK